VFGIPTLFLDFQEYSRKNNIEDELCCIKSRPELIMITVITRLTGGSNTGVFRIFVIQATGTPLSTFFRSLGSIGTGSIIGFIYSWQLSLLILAITPFILLGGYIQMKMKNRARNESNKGLEQAGQVCA